MKMKRLNELFDVSYGNKLDWNKMKPLPRSKGGINFVGRSSQNHGVVGTIAPLPSVEPYEVGIITVSLGGTKLLSSFVQGYPFYTAQNIAVLKPKKEMTFSEKLFICICIRHNRFRYSAFGREANRTIRTMLIPDPCEFPQWLNEVTIDTIEGKSAPASTKPTLSLNGPTWKAFKISDLFDLKKGKRLTKADMVRGNTPFIGSIDNNNGVSHYIGQRPIHEGNTITVNYNGSVAEAFYQREPFWASDDVNVLYPKFKLTPAIAIFLITIIRQEKYRFNYGRKWHLERMEQSYIQLPAQPNGAPDWEFMDQYIKTLPFSSQI